MKNTDSTNKRGNCPVPRADWAINISADDAKQEAEQMEADFVHLQGECLDEREKGSYSDNEHNRSVRGS
ncbi:hypothetical protein [Photobacterium kishitanii]|uniref:Uncharacterized protein n=1 Tax=Photobacterium kishitanii TaxID=318456 RepID=A0A2T3KME5_9GAMM|nr:hypothetical protein [Photobacterium kishitanii]PSV00977.1 hypothetical protein C9J27_02830 [Photobacterium kishitanii]